MRRIAQICRAPGKLFHQPLVAILSRKPRRMPKELHGTNRDRSSGFNSPPCLCPDGKRICPFGCGAGLPSVSSSLVAGAPIFGCSSAVERLTVNQDVVGSIPTSRARNERKVSGGMPVGVHRLKRTAERPLTNLLSPGPEISRRMPVELHNHLVAGSSPAIAFRDVAQLDRAVEMFHQPLVAVADVRVRWIDE